MDPWNDFVYFHLLEIAKTDKDYQQCLAQLRRIEPHYRQILDTLMPDERDLVTAYAALLDEMEYRIAQLAYEYGKISRE